MKFFLGLLILICTALGVGTYAQNSTNSYYYDQDELLNEVASVEFLYAPIGTDEEFDVLGTLSGEQDDTLLVELSKIEFKEYGFLSCVEPVEFGGMAIKLVYEDNSSEIICMAMTKYYDSEGNETDKKWKNCLEALEEWKELFAPYVEYLE